MEVVCASIPDEDDERGWFPFQHRLERRVMVCGDVRAKQGLDFALELE